MMPAFCKHGTDVSDGKICSHCSLVDRENLIERKKGRAMTNPEDMLTEMARAFMWAAHNINWDAATADERRDVLDGMRAAVACQREPNQPMDDAVSDAMDEWATGSKDVWQAGIDAMEDKP